MRIHLAADHAAYELKEHLAEHLRAGGHDVVDHGAHEYDPQDDYPSFCFAAGEAVVAEPGTLGPGPWRRPRSTGRWSLYGCGFGPVG